MPITKDDSTLKHYFKIKEVAQELNENPHTIRWWISQYPDFLGHIKRKAGARMGDRVLTKEQIERLRTIQFYKSDENKVLTFLDKAIKVDEKYSQ